MIKNGYILIDVIVGFFLLGLISVTCFPIIVSSFNNFNKIKDRSEMMYLGEMVVERLKADKDFSMEVIPLIEKFDSIDLNDILIENEIDSERYDCILYKVNSEEKLIDLRVNVSLKDQENGFNVDFKASIPKE
ncbi:hypothetical protein [Paratissierella segnis]|jgi:hypothetical protein|uniref:Uncharacterized protein n=1 Tax=Paratissierella segnis TaxID=2763679 RepID=A0A926IJX0_9FIRM|nr:hypothetical protein [Paratissierella segnis]MBC8588449.1 hypothetical protein [Paratissierella segnis]